MPQAHSERFWHLPPGRQPGPQSNRRLGMGKTIGRWILAFILAVCGLGMLGLGVYAAAEAADDVGALGILACLAFGLGFLGGIWFLFRGKKPLLAKHFDVSAEPLEPARGGEVAAELTINDPASVGERLEVGLVCTAFSDYEYRQRTQHGTTTSRQSREVLVHEQWEPASRDQPSQSFRFTIPAEAPFSHEGDCLSFSWRVTAREPTGMRRDPSSHQPLWVTP